MSHYSYASGICEEVLRKLSTSQNLEDRLVNALSELTVTTENDYLDEDIDAFLELRDANAERLDPDKQDKLAQSIVDFCVKIIRVDENAQAISETEDDE